MVAVFDTAFHQTMPQKAFMYAVPYSVYEDLGVRRYGFHGTSHKYVSLKAAAMLGKPVESLKIITCHLGNGSSIAAVDCGKSIDTSMGFTPLEGLPMGTRSGSIDPAILSYLMDKENLTCEEVNRILNRILVCWDCPGLAVTLGTCTMLLQKEINVLSLPWMSLTMK